MRYLKKHEPLPISDDLVRARESFSAKANNLLMWIENGSHNSPKPVPHNIASTCCPIDYSVYSVNGIVGMLKTHNIYLYISSLTNIQTAIELHVKWHLLLLYENYKVNIGNWSIDTKGGQLANCIMKATFNCYEFKWKC